MKKGSRTCGERERERERSTGSKSRMMPLHFASSNCHGVCLSAGAAAVRLAFRC